MKSAKRKYLDQFMHQMKNEELLNNLKTLFLKQNYDAGVEFQSWMQVSIPAHNPVSCGKLEGKELKCYH